MKKRIGWIAAGIVVLLVGGGYATYDYFTGNHVEVQEVIAEADTAAASGEAVTADELNGEWTAVTGSEVYLSLKTSKEPVNMTMGEVAGSWKVDLENQDQLTAAGTVNLTGVDSGNPTRDGHIMGDKFLDTTSFPEATFTAQTFNELPADWSEGVPVSFQMTGTLTVKGISKEVVFDSKAVYDQGQLKLEGNTVVTFADFGMANPHQVVMETENNVNVQLQLILDKTQA